MHTFPALGTSSGPGRRARQWAVFLARCVLGTYHILLVVVVVCGGGSGTHEKIPKKKEKRKKSQKKPCSPYSPSNTGGCVSLCGCGVRGAAVGAPPVDIPLVCRWQLLRWLEALWWAGVQGLPSCSIDTFP